MLIVLDDAAPRSRVLRQADMIIANQRIKAANGTPQFALSELDRALDAVA
jgi:hypothetical protein